MALGRTAITSGIRCARCQLSLLRTFTSLSNVSLPATQRARSSPLPGARPFASSAALQQPRKSRSRKQSQDKEFEPLVEGHNWGADDARPPSLTEATASPTIHTPNESIQSSSSELQLESQPHSLIEEPIETNDTELSSADPAARETTSSDLPWYLQGTPQTPTLDPSSPLAARQKLPDLPPNPPPLLSTLLTHISTDLGIDDLSLLDLRSLNPPAALGSNLIMLLGTARSEKHLHVSADRFCRYLRKEHGLRPYAAGLLGRNELKIKLRRKAKRAKTMAAAGAADDGAPLDDGIRTGWICVTVGRVPAAEEDMIEREGLEEEQEEEGLVEGYVGFGEDVSGVTLVVQMFVEEKRAETDLEGLWSGVARSQERKYGGAPVDEVGEVDVSSDKGGFVEELEQTLSVREQRSTA